MPRVTFIHSEGKSGEVPENLTLLEAAEMLGFDLEHDCGGNASCSTCRVEILYGGENLSEMDFEEQDLLDREALTEPYHRLSCQSRILGTVVVQVPEEKWGTTDRTEPSQANSTGELAPAKDGES